MAAHGHQGKRFVSNRKLLQQVQVHSFWQKEEAATSKSQEVQYELNVERNKAVGWQAGEEMESIAANKLMVQDFWPFLV